MITLPPFNPSLFVKSAQKYCHNVFQKNNSSKAIIGISGGIDSAVTVAILVAALGKDRVEPVFMPYGSLHTSPHQRAFELLDNLSIPVSNAHVFPITNIVQSFSRLQPDRVRSGNIMARVRMMILFDYAKKLGGLVAGTENKSEHLLGYYTRFGDEASDLELIRSLYKTHVFELASYLHVPESIQTASPSANLWEDQTDEDELGFSYKQADPILYGLFDKHWSMEQLLNRGADKQLVEKINTRVQEVSYKHCVPYVFNYPL